MTRALRVADQRGTSSVRRRRLARVPDRIAGLYRLSVLSKRPFEVDIGGRTFANVRSLEVYHEAPMFIDEIAGLAAVHAETCDGVVQAVGLLPGNPEPLEFRITAEETVPELDVLEGRAVVGRFNTPVHYRGLGHYLKRHSDKTLESISRHLTQPNSVGDHVASVICAPIVAAAAAAPALPRALAATGLAGAVWAAAFWATQQTLQTGVVYVPLACDPSRTYINGQLFKNLAEVRVRIAGGRIVGYATP